MGSEDLEVVRKGYAAFTSGDLGALRELFTEDATWTVPGSGYFSGTKQGRDAVLAHLAELMARSEGSLRTTQLALAEGDGYVFSLDRSEANRNGVSFDATNVNVFQLRAGRVQSVQQYFEDTAEGDKFWA